MADDIHDDVLDRLARERHVWLCTVRPNGTPHVTPVWFVYLADTWWVGSSERNLKTRNIVAEPRVTLALADADAPVVAEGRALVHRRDFPDDVVLYFAQKYQGWDVAEVWETGGARVLLEIPVTRWLFTGTAP
jgi:PPOX class probable F420-dependent enzyme